MSQQERATILLIDDHPMLRTGVKQLISMAPDIQVIGEASKVLNWRNRWIRILFCWTLICRG